MKRTKSSKVVSILLMSAMIILFNVSVFAADNTGFNDLTSTLSNTSTNSGANNTNSSSNNTNTNTNNSNTNSNTTNSNRTNTNTNSNNTSIYNTNLPKTGVESSMPMGILLVIFGVSAIYAYRKIKEYKNI